ncbi:MAG: DUF4474 domain-containing protein [Clostridia bacterium]|nr:DUF4474 domain-containing protein [Clostridia bacterium]
MFENLENINPYYLIPIIFAVVIIIAYIIFRKRAIDKGPIADEELYAVIKNAGYIYDDKNDVFYSDLYAWQRDMGYCRLYDEAAAHFSIIMDCEPIYFEYAGKRWMIEFWKGQYGMTTGCEIGVYYTDRPDLNIPGIFDGTFYDCVSDQDLLYMEFSLFKDGKMLFTRRDRHWWLTGFKLGEFAEPSQLTMNLRIRLNDREMTKAFVEGLQRAGYQRYKQFKVEGSIVTIKYDKPYTRQPYSRSSVTDWFAQRRNKVLCNRYRKITRDYDNFPDKIRVIQRKAPGLFNIILNFGKNKYLYDKFEIIKNHLKAGR